MGGTVENNVPSLTDSLIIAQTRFSTFYYHFKKVVALFLQVALL